MATVVCKSGGDRGSMIFFIAYPPRDLYTSSAYGVTVRYHQSNAFYNLHYEENNTVGIENDDSFIST